jgi:hypothetical protein
MSSHSKESKGTCAVLEARTTVSRSMRLWLVSGV